MPSKTDCLTAGKHNFGYYKGFFKTMIFKITFETLGASIYIYLKTIKNLFSLFKCILLGICFLNFKWHRSNTLRDTSLNAWFLLQIHLCLLFVQLAKICMVGYLNRHQLYFHAAATSPQKCSSSLPSTSLSISFLSVMRKWIENTLLPLFIIVVWFVIWVLWLPLENAKHDEEITRYLMIAPHKAQLQIYHCE